MQPSTKIQWASQFYSLTFKFAFRFDVRSKTNKKCKNLTTKVNIFSKLSQKRNLSLNSNLSGHQKWPAYEWLAVAYPTKLFVYMF